MSSTSKWNTSNPRRQARNGSTSKRTRVTLGQGGGNRLQLLKPRERTRPLCVALGRKSTTILVRLPHNNPIGRPDDLSLSPGLLLALSRLQHHERTRPPREKPGHLLRPRPVSLLLIGTRNTTRLCIHPSSASGVSSEASLSGGTGPGMRVVLWSCLCSTCSSAASRATDPARPRPVLRRPPRALTSPVSRDTVRCGTHRVALRVLDERLRGGCWRLVRRPPAQRRGKHRGEPTTARFPAIPGHRSTHLGRRAFQLYPPPVRQVNLPASHTKTHPSTAQAGYQAANAAEEET